MGARSNNPHGVQGLVVSVRELVDLVKNSTSVLNATAAVARRPRPAGVNTRKKILDAAEALFGQGTYDTVSLRDIAKRADVTLHLASYHFGSKDRLFAAVVARRAAVLSDLRRDRLARLFERGEPSTEAIVDAFMRPLLDKMVGESRGWRSYLLILAQLGHGNRWLDLLHTNFDPTAELFLKKLAQALPDVPHKALVRGFALTLVAMLETLSKNRRLDTLSGGKISADDLSEAYRVLLKFCVGGLESLRRPKRPKSGRASTTSPTTRRRNHAVVPV